MDRTAPFICRSCGAGCGMIAHLDGETVVKVVGDVDHPVSQGYTCPKGRGIPLMHHGAHRLSQPVMAGGQVSWDVCLDDIAANLQRQLADHGPNSIAGYAGTGLFTDSIGWWIQARFLQRLDSRQNYSSSTVDISPLFAVNELVTGFSWIYPTWDPADASPSLVLMFGVNPGVSHGYVGSKLTNPTQQIRGFRARGGELWVIDPRATRTAGMADRHMASRPGSDVFVLGWLLREVLADGFDSAELAEACAANDVAQLRSALIDFTLQDAIEQASVPEADLIDLLAAVRRHRKVAFLPGTGLGFGEHGVLAAWLGLALMIVTGSLDRPGGLRYNAGGFGGLATERSSERWTGHAPVGGHQEPGPASRPELHRYMGEAPAVALVNEIEAGNIRTLFIGGGNPLTAIPDPDRLRRALRTLDMVVVIDAFDNDLTRIATHALPCTGQMERADLQSHYRLQFTEAVVAPHPGRRDTWWMYDQIALRLGLDLFDGALDPRRNSDEAMAFFGAAAYGGFDALRSAGTHGVDVPRHYDWVHDQVLPEGMWRLAPRVLLERLTQLRRTDRGDVRLVCGRITENNNSSQYSRKRGQDEGPLPIHLSPDVATAADVRDGDRVRVTSASGQVEGTAHVDLTLAVGVVWMSHGWPTQNVAALIDGHDIDPLTGQPIMTGISVRVTALR
jgi:anaerobic selenocysteine-containing dehydrogenase